MDDDFFTLKPIYKDKIIVTFKPCEGKLPPGALDEQISTNKPSNSKKYYFWTFDYYSYYEYNSPEDAWVSSCVVTSSPEEFKKTINNHVHHECEILQLKKPPRCAPKHLPNAIYFRIKVVNLPLRLLKPPKNWPKYYYAALVEVPS